MKVHKNKKYWTDFLVLYKNSPALWKVKSKLYSDRVLKAQSYETLAEKLRESDPDADREAVVRKINAFRTNYRRDTKRIKESLEAVRQGKPGAKVYESSLWYFDLLKFLDDYKMEDGESDDLDEITEYQMVNEEEEEFEIENYKMEPTEEQQVVTIQPDQTYNHTEQTQKKRSYVLNESIPQSGRVSVSHNSRQTPIMQQVKKQKFSTPPKIVQHMAEENFTEHQTVPETISYPGAVVVDASKLESLITLNCNQLKEHKTEASVLARSWSNQYNELEKKQKMYARKFISDVLFYGCMGLLSDQTALQLQQIFEDSQVEYVPTQQEYADSDDV